MKDTIILLLLFVGLVVAYKRLHRSESIAVPIPVTQIPSKKTEPAHKPLIRKRVATRASKKLPSIYHHESKKLLEEEEEKAEPLAANSPESNATQTNVGGVPVEDWILSLKNHISQQDPSSQENPLKVYLQCHELTKGTAEFVGDHKCLEISAKRRGNAQTL